MLRVLAIEDQPDIRCAKIVSMCDLRIAQGYNQIKFYMDYFKPELILLDHDMPGFNGMDVINAFGERFVSIPIIIWSHNHEAVRKMKALLDDMAIQFDVPDDWCIVVQPYDPTYPPEDHIKFFNWLNKEHGRK